MFENVNEVAVLVCAILAIAVGSVWYSPLLFGEYWMRAVGITESELDTSRERLVKLLSFAMVANLVLLFTIAQFVEFARSLGQPVWTTAILLVILIASVMVSMVIWEKKTVSYLLINVGYATIVVFGGMSVLWYWPW